MKLPNIYEIILNQSFIFVIMILVDINQQVHTIRFKKAPNSFLPLAITIILNVDSVFSIILAIKINIYIIIFIYFTNIIMYKYIMYMCYNSIG